MKFEIPELNISSYFKNSTIEGDIDGTVSYVSSLDNADEYTLTFYSGDDLIRASSIKCKVLIVKEEFSGCLENFNSATIVYSNHPKFTFVKLLSDLVDDNYSDQALDSSHHAGISKYSYVEKGVKLGNNTLIFPNSTVYKNTVIGSNCIIQSGSVLGGNGLGDVWYDGAFHKFVHLGGLLIGDDVSIGTNVSILKGMLENTAIGDGTKIGNNVNIGHSVEIGKNCYISSGVTLGGACKIQDNCWIAPGVTLNDHVLVEKNTKIGTGSVLIKDAASDSFYLGNPARKIGAN